MTNESPSIRVRLAPSPTGYLHIGTARTALFNWLFARHHGGVFVLRIEDTDEERSSKEYEENILTYLQWLGLDWDEGPEKGGEYGPYRQSERMDRYASYIADLLQKGHAYRCFCTKEELAAEREEARARGEAPRYSGTCYELSIEEQEKRKAAGDDYVIRFHVPDEEIVFEDLVRGPVSFDGSLIGDFVIARDEEHPLYNLAVVIDDMEMAITHVIRGEDHISNTPRQILIHRALEAPAVVYAHLPLILAPDKSKMSKRAGVFNMSDYEKEGYLPEAVFNYMALLGWHPTDEQELFERDELAKQFDIHRVQKGGAIFNIEKLNWINAEYLKRSDDERLYQLLVKGLRERGWDDEEKVLRIIAIEKERMKKLSEFYELAEFFFELPAYDSEQLVWRKGTPADAAKHLAHVQNILEKLDADMYTQDKLEEVLMSYANAEGRGDVLWPLRFALSGQKASPGPFEILSILGKEDSLRRIRIARDKLEG